METDKENLGWWWKFFYSLLIVVANFEIYNATTVVNVSYGMSYISQAEKRLLLW
jgi:hypothetical protein